MATVSILSCRCGFSWPQPHSLAIIKDEKILYVSCHKCDRLVSYTLGQHGGVMSQGNDETTGQQRKQ